MMAEFPACSYHVITCVATTHHLPFTSALTSFCRNLARGGTLMCEGAGLPWPRQTDEQLDLFFVDEDGAVNVTWVGLDVDHVLDDDALAVAGVAAVPAARGKLAHTAPILRFSWSCRWTTASSRT
jgi:hypothetical protein